MRSCILLFVFASASFAQLFSVGVRGGVPVTSFLDSVQGRNWSFSADRDQYLVGPTVALNLPLGFSIQLDALYRRIGYNYTVTGGTTTVNANANSWQFPLMAKWAFVPGPVKPFIAGGVAFQHVTDLSLLGQAISDVGVLQNNPTVGATFGLGIQLKIGKLRIEPEARYTRWGVDALNNPIRTVVEINRNQGDFLLGITF